MTVLRNRMVVIGAGGHAKVVIELARSLGSTIMGCTDSNAIARSILHAPVIGDDSILTPLLRNGTGVVAVGLGDNAARLKAAILARDIGFEIPIVVSRDARVSQSAIIGEGTAIMAGAAINAEAIVAEFAIVNTSASIDHECVIGSGAHIAPGAVLTGGVRVGARTLIGAGAVVTPNRKIGADVVIGAGAVVISDIADGCKAVGVPARVIQ